MKASDMALACLRAMVEPGLRGVVFTVPRGGLPPGFPRGELLNEMRRDGRVERTYSFDPHRVFSWLMRSGLVTLRSLDGGAVRVVDTRGPEDGPGGHPS